MSCFNINLRKGSFLQKSTAYKRKHLLYNKVISVLKKKCLKSILKLAHQPSTYEIPW